MNTEKTTNCQGCPGIYSERGAAGAKNRRKGKVSLPFDWDFLQDNLPSEKHAELRRRFMEEWRSGAYTKKEMMKRYRMSEWTFWYTIKRYADAKELGDYNKTPTEVRIAVTGVKGETSQKIEKWDTFFRTILY